MDTKKYTNLYIIIILIAVTIIIVTTLVVTNIRTEQKKQDSNQPTTTIPLASPSGINYSPKYQEQARKIRQEEAIKFDKETIVGQLLIKLPHQGTNFWLGYDYVDLQFIATISKANQTQGLTELDNYLKANNIQSRDWITNLIIQYK
jgi:ABC-type lipoprotein release transport system permease subunit